MLKDYRLIILKRSLFLYLIHVIYFSIFSFLTYIYKTLIFFPLILIIPLLFVYFLPQIYSIFNKFKSYHGKYRKRIMKLSSDHGVNIKDIVSSKTGYSGAALGLGDNKIIFINSRILKQPWKEIKSLYLHEFAHFRNKDLEFMALYPVILCVAFCSFIYIFQIRLLDIILLLIFFSSIEFLLYLVILRSMEKKADNYTIKDNPDAWIKLILKGINFLKSKNVYVPKNISFLKYLSTHPWVYDRIKQARDLKK
jgi:Zn-dependent protease with chaperone function